VLSPNEQIRQAVEEALRHRYPLLEGVDLTEAWQAALRRLPPARRSRQYLQRSKTELLFLFAAEEAVRLLLTSDDVERQQRGVRIVAERYKDPVAVQVRERFPSLSSQRLAEVWCETFRDLLLTVRDGTFPAEGDLLSYLSSRALHRAAQRDRRRQPPQPPSLEEALLTFAEHPTLQDATEQQRFLALLMMAIRQLPDGQRQALETYVAHFPSTQDLTFLRRQLVASTGEDTSLEAVERNLTLGRRTVSQILWSNGYPLDAGGDA
jgi:hypothetical protein